jgi:hypothetical protein
MQLVGATILSVVLLFAARNGVAIADLSHRVNRIEEEWEDLGPRKAEAIRLIQQATENIEIREELEGWQKSRMVWHVQLDAFADCVPDTIQLTSLSVQHDFTLASGKKAVGRSFSISMSGRCFGIGGERFVQSFKTAMEQSERLGPLDSVEVARFGEDPKKPEDRVFSVKCPYKVRSF